MNELSQDHLIHESLFHLRSTNLPGQQEFLASIRLDRSASPWELFLTQGSRFAEQRLQSADVEAGLGAWLQQQEGNFVVLQDHPVHPGELCSVLGVLGVHWRTESGASLYHVRHRVVR